MKLYEYAPFPNPRRVRVFLAEKGVNFQSVNINVPEGEHRSDTFRQINPWAAVPVLELDDGTHIAETQAICKYVEQTHPEPPLMGRDAKEQAVVEMWQRRIEQNAMERLATYFHVATPGLGELEPHHNPEYGQYCASVALDMFTKLDRELSDKDYIAGNFSVADITGLCALDFADLLQLEIPDHLQSLRAWHQRLAARPSAQA